MSKLLFDLRNVPDEEADEVRELLTAHALDFFETKPLGWGLFGGGIWITDDLSLGTAKALLAQYQLQRQATAQARYAAAKREGTEETLLTTLRREPGNALILIFTILFVVALTVLPFVLLSK